MGMEKRDMRDRERIYAVIELLRKQAPLTVKQEKFCNGSCVQRFLKSKGGNVKKAAKHLRAVLSWRDAIGADHLIADEFSSELADGLAYVAGHDDEGRPVLVFRIKQEYLKFHTQKSYLRFLVFTLEVAISTMSRFVEQFVLLYNASFFGSAPAFLNLYMMTFKVISEYYPGQLHKALVVDPPSIFSCLWKGARPFVEQWATTAVVSSHSVNVIEEARCRAEDDREKNILSSCPHRTMSLRYDPSPTITKSDGSVGSTSSRFAFTASHFNSLKPWYMSSVAATQKSTSVGPASPSIVGANARSFSFASPATRSMPVRNAATLPSPSPRPQHRQQQPGTPLPSFLQSPSMLFGFGRKNKDGNTCSRAESFKTYVWFYARSYDEIAYRSMMQPPLCGLLSIVSPHLLKQRRQFQENHSFFSHVRRGL